MGPVFISKSRVTFSLSILRVLDMMMMAVGFALGVMVPAIGINYLYQRKSGLLFAIDAGHFTLGMAAMGGAFLLFL